MKSEKWDSGLLVVMIMKVLRTRYFFSFFFSICQLPQTNHLESLSMQSKTFVQRMILSYLRKHC